ncbi:MAG: L-aspartate oxidase [Acidobacteriia bacterium]|nr:L-aspartate oxidase [Terriglobia bacterium]
MLQTDLLIIGSGIAGCAAAHAAAKQGVNVLLLTKNVRPEESNTYYAQGGIIFRGDNDAPEKLMKDILKAGAGLCYEPAVRILSEEGPRRVQEILIDELGVPFDVIDETTDEFHLTAEAAHSVPRILHYKDVTGRAIENTFVEAIKKNPRIRFLTNTTAMDLLTLSHHSLNPQDVYRPPLCVGAHVLMNESGAVETVVAKETILATGGLGRVFLHTTNPVSARGDGIAMAYRAGARCINMQYVQFHPTTLFHPSGRFLISESLRGEGARLVDSAGQEFMKRFHPDGSLAPRDVVARGIHQWMIETGESCAWLDISHKDSEWIRNRFPGIYEKCRSLDIDITREPIPVVPAAHYSCGGVAVDEFGRSNVHRLRAVGEVACTGVHGANRLASTSLLEGLVWGTRAGEQAAQTLASSTEENYFPEIAPWILEKEQVDPALIAQDWLTIQQTMWNYVGLVRSTKRLDRAHEILRELHLEIERFYDKAALSDALVGLRHGIQTALVILLAAIECRESRGCHYRID